MSRDTSELANEFHRRMLAIYADAARLLGYRATRFLQVVSERGGVDAAKHLIGGEVQDGFVRLTLAGRSDLTMESLMLEERFRPLFSEDELSLARQRLGVAE